MTNRLQYKKYEQSNYDLVKEILLKDESTNENLLNSLKLWPDYISIVYLDDKLVGMMQLIFGRNTSSLIVYVYPEYRHKGIGEAIINYGEEQLKEIHPKNVETEYIETNENSRHFARKHGYDRFYSCTSMKYTGGKFDLDNNSTDEFRQYCDDDYTQAHELYAVAFHQMRLKVGDFPNSVVEQPSERNRKAWAQDYLNGYTYIHNGEIVGHAHLEDNKVGSISVRTDLHGQGIGRNFLKHICNLIYDKGFDYVMLDCVVGNPARYLYDSLGFKELYTVENGVKHNL